MSAAPATCPTRGGRARQSLRTFWQVLRTLVGDDAYERYCSHHRAHHGNAPLLSRRAFYLQAQQEKWTGIKRCC